MGLITKTVKLVPKMGQVTYFKKLGYVFNKGDEIEVSVSDLSNGSHIPVDCKCDYCGCKFQIAYCQYVRNTKSVVNKLACKNCRTKKATESNMIQYGVKSPMSRPSVKESVFNTIREKYGVDNYSQTEEYKQKIIEYSRKTYGTDYIFQSEEIKNKIVDTNINKYGTSCTLHFPETHQKVLSTFNDRYGCDNPMKNKDIQNKTMATNEMRYGYKYTTQVPLFKEQMRVSLYNNQSVPTSSQQLYLASLYQMELNYPIIYWNVDMYDPECRLIVEYDGGGHNLSVKFGNISQSEFNRKEYYRDSVIKSNGYKTMRIISENDKLPYDDILMRMLFDAKQYFICYENHSWIEFNINKGTVRNAENKDGQSYNFGALRRIKKLDKVIGG